MDREKSHRPLPVTFLACCFIVLAVWEMVQFVLLATVWRLTDFPPPKMMLLVTGILWLYGVGMLKGRNWVRKVYLILSPVGWALSLLGGASLAWLFCGAIFYVIAARILTRPEVKAFFGVNDGVPSSAPIHV